MAKVHNPSLYRSLHNLRKGRLHRALGVPESEKIPADKMQSAMNSKNPAIRKMASFAHTMSTWKH